ncbi:MAG: GNAT family N-acetyltransferase [Pseudonocardiaceae bacterium]
MAWVRGTPAGYAELHAQPAGHVELTSFGLLPCFTGQGLGRHLLTVALHKAWTIANRWPHQQPTGRVWLHTCSQDSPVALPPTNPRDCVFIAPRLRPCTCPLSPWPGAHRQQYATEPSKRPAH